MDILTVISLLLPIFIFAVAFIRIRILEDFVKELLDSMDRFFEGLCCLPNISEVEVGFEVDLNNNDGFEINPGD